ncbi:hypothetical protein H112_05779 [Trichophyton rubrum D6]|uniref:Uncharacterized protein n=3 Tax=Trichophyton TaxID=5550 RepID=F2SKD8_TRIRC|nr:uncharacterized protein TERG_03491 [Trichophyton rubrum CBS 118892]EZF16338.1 hypothetical protein H100_05796 [Trichophyton rubrum MR850]EZF40209.1 hypothetical protein H102_05764 [Trichophyton rubrum CBS 100081]EZF50981.1 hypothetical protein H103_05791 [Trichophyton rubrum CBS 288.86]EZF61454.1 hypothetical protein H104_05775 [Trichophyton rubrum CBS 289.86]EZF72085.1 hypothetical protein H105_05804 [Trichophyton soudanense CBS 452.61]EZF82807.1 hypothetical protein H110_05784 [Trichophy
MSALSDARRDECGGICMMEEKMACGYLLCQAKENKQASTMVCQCTGIDSGKGRSAQKEEPSQKTSNPLSEGIIGGLGERTYIHGAMAEQQRRARKEINGP